MSKEPSRRAALRQIAGMPLALTACGGGSTAPQTPPPVDVVPRNVLMIAVDDLNNWTGFLRGHPQVRTPNMDALAARSTVFRRAYCNAPLCSPSRASALTGLFPHETGVFGNNDSLSVTRPSARYMPMLMGDRGMESRVLGKIYHVFDLGNQPLPAATPSTNLRCAGGPTTPPWGLWDWAGTDPESAHHPDGRYAQTAIDFLGQAHAKPFFLGVGFVRTHVPWYVPQRFFDLYPLDTLQLPYAPPDDLDDVPAAGQKLALSLNAHDCIVKQNLWASAVQAYLAAISFVDEQIGRVIAALDASEHAKDTLVVLWSDNGFHLGEKFHWHKMTLWEQATHVPFMMRMPGQATGQNVDQVVSLIDMMPTIFDLIGMDGPANYSFSGRSLRPLLNEPGLAWDHPVLITHQPHDHAVRTNTWRYIRYASAAEELYDTVNDPGELHNLASDPALASVKTELGRLMPG